MIRIWIEGRAKTGKSTVAHLIAQTLEQNGIPCELENVDGDAQHVFATAGNRIVAIRERMLERAAYVTISERQSAPVCSA